MAAQDPYLLVESSESQLVTKDMGDTGAERRGPTPRCKSILFALSVTAIFAVVHFGSLHMPRKQRTEITAAAPTEMLKDFELLPGATPTTPAPFINKNGPQNSTYVYELVAVKCGNMRCAKNSECCGGTCMLPGATCCNPKGRLMCTSGTHCCGQGGPTPMCCTTGCRENKGNLGMCSLVSETLQKER
eukprot:TRINITY_DN69753_c0_g1_i1.p1 TRINITY_DN69753_c0_g1~~TRINITY_DN69753_c0_g1_i1.p1  ORF type:complete len:188 (-),score=20.57 TRINITY_DN69753_c0_g1_i1:38-601(-)